MTKLKTISITGIRGIKDTLNLSPDKKSLLIYGDNGAGKSSITDSIEWFYKDKIAHLAGTEIGKDAIRNVFLTDDEDAKIDIHFSDDKLDTEKSIDDSLKRFNTNNSKEFYQYLVQSQTENLILRYRDLVSFIIATKGEKLTYLQEIIGFSEVREIRGLLKKFAGRFAKDIKAANYSNKKSTQQSILMECLGQNITSNEQFFEVTTKLIKPLKLEKEIKSFRDAREILKSLETKEDSQIVTQINFFNKVAEILTEIRGQLPEINKGYNSFYSLFTELKKDSEKIKKLQLLALLTEGLKVLKKDIVREDFCPLCQQAISKIELINDLNQRIEELKELKKEKEKLEEQSDDLRNVIQNNLTTISSLQKEKLLNEKDTPKLFESIQEIKNAFNTITEELKKDILSSDEIKELKKIEINETKINTFIEASKERAKKLTDSIKGNIKLQIHTKLTRAIDAYITHRKIEKEQEILTNQQITFEALYTDFIKRQEEALEAFLRIFSDSINEYYTTMNPSEKVEDITLVTKKDKYDELEGITISYKFYNKKQSPPNALLSESHINCLGLSFFLASVKAFNKTNKFFILDDVISSFDSNHRTRFIKLLIDKFSDYQIILMTHEKDFFEIATSEVKKKDWVIKSLKWTPETGVCFEIPLLDLRAKIEEKFKVKNTDGLGNDIRKYGERQLKQIACCIEANLAYRFNDRNEERMMNELLSGIQGKINKYSPNDLKKKSNIDNILASPLLIANKTSHDNDFKENISDLEVFWEEIRKLLKLFYCSEEKCKSFISVKNLDTVNNQIRCNCGKVSYEWKK